MRSWAASESKMTSEFPVLNIVWVQLNVNTTLWLHQEQTSDTILNEDTYYSPRYAKQ